MALFISMHPHTDWYGGFQTTKNFVVAHDPWLDFTVAEQNRLMAYVESSGYTFHGWRVTTDYIVYNDGLTASRLTIVESQPVAKRTSTYVGYSDQKIVSVGPDNNKKSIIWDGYLEYMKQGQTVRGNAFKINQPYSKRTVGGEGKHSFAKLLDEKGNVKTKDTFIKAENNEKIKLTPEQKYELQKNMTSPTWITIPMRLTSFLGHCGIWASSRNGKWPCIC